MEIKDNFLNQKDFDILLTHFIDSSGLSTIDDQNNDPHPGQSLPWFYNDKIDYFTDENKFQFIHPFYGYCIPNSPSIEILNSILEKINPLAIYRIKANLLTRTPNIEKNEFHMDIGGLDDFPEKLKHWTTSIFYINTNNGYTEFEDGTKVESVVNRMVTFPSNIKHRGTSCTDEKTRIVINFNYFRPNNFLDQKE